jgi:hypothetical membrane protein
MTTAESGLQGQAWRAVVLIYASVQFLLLTAIAMLVYPGGAVYEPNASRYLFFRNFFSDLGATVTPSGRPNLASHVLFAIALGSVGLALILASSNWQVIAARRQRSRSAGWASQAFEIVAGLGFIGIAATPWNLVLDAHNGFVRAAFGFLLATTSVFCSSSFAISGRRPTRQPMPPTSCFSSPTLPSSSSGRGWIRKAAWSSRSARRRSSSMPQ